MCNCLPDLYLDLHDGQDKSPDVPRSTGSNDSDGTALGCKTDTIGYPIRMSQSPLPVTTGTAIFFMGDLYHQNGNKMMKVILKTLQFNPNLDIQQRNKIQIRLNRERLVWETLCHVNIVPFLGTWTDQVGTTYLVSVFYEQRRILEAAQTMTRDERIDLYMHGRDIAHGDLRPENIVLDNTMNPRILDFGYSKILHGYVGIFTTSNPRQTTTRYTPPEIFYEAENAHEGDRALSRKMCTKKGDVWSFGMVTLPILYGKEPYYTVPFDTLAERFEQPANFIMPKMRDYVTGWDPAWCIMEQCCHQFPNLRPNVMDVVICR
ncbi:kinase-like protein [Rickenella mellea]|uniref:Kinase-like protein n=1 Tax=Rickenella mellea TaxID=50990 RepID=A0A4Y7QGJ8_9AGAM|nr:kinase-like protein [Rickenella mellea]